MNKKGISLVALVITIIVLIILTGAVIATFIEGGIIDKAKDAVKRSDYTTLREAYDMAYNVAKIDMVTGTGEEIDEINVLKETVDELGLKGFTFTEDSVSYDGDNNYIEEWLEELRIKEGNTELPTTTTVYLNAVSSRTEEEFKYLLGSDYVIEKPAEYEGELVPTGSIIKDTEENIVGNIALLGDINGDAKVNVEDVSKVHNAILGVETLTEEQLIAADVNFDGLVTPDDVNLIMNNYLGSVTFDEIKTVNTLPVISETSIYVWYEETELIEKLSEYYTILEDSSGIYNITIESGHKYKDLKNNIIEALNMDTTDITIFVTDINTWEEPQVTNLDTEITSDIYSIRIILPYKLNETECIKDCELVFLLQF